MSYHHLNARERMILFYHHQLGLSLRAIGRKLNRPHTTLSRELKRNKRVIGCYCDQAAQHFADKRKALSRHTRRASNSQLKRYVFKKLSLGWSPEIISNRIQRDYPHARKTMRISPETIYQWIFKDAAQGGHWYSYLVRGRKRRRRQRCYGSLRGQIPNRISIDQRPSVVDRRVRYGDWEGDTMVGHRHQGRLVTYVERKSRLLFALKRPMGQRLSLIWRVSNCLKRSPNAIERQ